MKKGSTIIILIVFIITLGILGMHIFNITAPSSANTLGTQTGMYARVADVDLGKVEVYNYQRMGFTHGFMKFSPDNQYLAVGTENGDVLMLDMKGKVLWKKNMGLSKITALQFSNDSKHLLIGDTSPQGCLLCWNVADGAEVWRQSTATELGVDIKEKTYPGIGYITTDRNGYIYIVANRSIRHTDNSSEYRGRIYKLDQSGNVVGMFPNNHNIDASVCWLSVDEIGEKVVFGTSNWDITSIKEYVDSVYCLDGSLQTVLWSTLLEPIPPYRNTTMRASPDISANGKYIDSMVSDGRAFLHDGEGKKLWEHSLSQPQKIGGVYINATGSYVQLIGDCVVVTTGNTYNRANWQLPTPVEHPSSNSVFTFDRNGKLIQKYKLGGMVEQLAVNENKAVLAVGRNVRTKDVKVHGLYVLSMPNGELIDNVTTIGPCVGSAISPNGQYIAGVEAPLQLDDGQVIGEYKVLLLKQRSEKTGNGE